jgi:haloacid dehalogenase superfamily, subfamily IA, variant 1 with third motif having Dx(3-4)D or Dx(3-4)E
MSLTYVFFDLDGTLTDPAEGITKSVAHALTFFGTEFGTLSDLKCFIGPPLMESFMQYYGYEKEKAKLAVEKYREYFKEKGIYENLLYDHVEELLQELKNRNHKIVLATSKPTVFAERILAHFEIKPYFDFIAGSNLDNTRTDKAEVIRYALDEMKLTKEETVIMVGDRMHDILGARKNLLRSVGVTYGYGTKEELVESGCTALAGSVRELKDLLITMLLQ